MGEAAWHERAGIEPIADLRSAGARSVAQDYHSLVSMKTDRRKHVRTAFYPQDKYVNAASTSMEIGWLQHDLSYPDGSGTWLRKVKHPRNSSKMTKYKDNMQLPGSYHILRFAK